MTASKKQQRMQAALRFLSTYEKDPPEVAKDDFAYDRLLHYVRRVALVGLGERESTANTADEDAEEHRAVMAELVARG